MTNLASTPKTEGGSLSQDGEEKEESLTDAASHLLDECRMILPGIQALFGFQMIAVFNAGFHQRLSPGERDLHLVAISLLTIATALVMTPAAFHRQTNPRKVTQEFVAISSKLLLCSMFPLVASLVLDCYLVARMIVPRSSWIPSALVLALLLVFLCLWFVLPRWRWLQRALAASRVE